MSAKNFMRSSQHEVGEAVRAAATPAPALADEAGVVAVIDHRTLDRECLVRAIGLASPDVPALGYDSVDAWLRAGSAPDTRVILYRAGHNTLSEAAFAEKIARLTKEAGDIPVMVIGESEDIREMIKAFDSGARGYLPSTVGIETIVEATRMSLGHGVFLPMTSLQALRSAFISSPQPSAEQFGQFTERQLAVCEALRRGKSNKTIAYELNLCESTVKVHIRTIMKKLRASNRTEAAFKLNTVCFGNDG
ncbi:LuxR C-terminal-related transcriptional regulator [Rubellimicrobium arenae]|uniref:LuxR C-terminal-related transcriptional regulator n=1 Tax=Rubellimicrobium arenae TaxID=2817372 RepID=UPI001FEE93E2|nr:response regulator transcription factor [Rubellimicrobium arenae]